MIANDGPVTRITSTVSSAITYIFRLQVEEFLARGITKGSLTLTRDDEPPHIFGETPRSAKSHSRPVATLHINNPPSFYARVASQADIGFAEAYIANDISVSHSDQLVTIFRLLILNRDDDSNQLSTTKLLISRLGAFVNTMLHNLNRNTMSGSQRNIQAHYDLSNELFATFLGPTWTYSCALFGPQAKTLDDAQTAKIDAVLTKARLTPDTHLLDIGSGWGELAIRAASTAGCRVTGITLSEEQLTLARQRAAEAGVDDRVQFELVDYRELARRGKQFDRVTSVEMLEAVGHEFLGEFFKCVSALMTAEAVAVLQVITTPEERYESYRTSTDFIQKHIFPGGICPSLHAMTSAMNKNGGQLIVEHLENMGVHYATTLAEWRRKFLISVKEGKVGQAGFDDIFVRKWIYYFAYCESGFATRTLGVLQMVLSRINNVSTLGGAPQAQIVSNDD